jgi:hypothetical protein
MAKIFLLTNHYPDSSGISEIYIPLDFGFLVDGLEKGKPSE